MKPESTLSALSRINFGTVCAALMLSAIIGCTTTYKVTTSQSKPGDIARDKFFEQTAGDSWTVDLVKGEQLTAAIVPIHGDSVALISTHDSVTLSLKDIRSVSKRHYLFGLLVYPPSATVAGGLLGAGLGQSSSDGGFWSGFSGFTVGVIVGGVLGSTIAILNPPETIYEIAVTQ